MNKKYIINIPLKDGTNKLNFNVNVLLYPFYISETALLSSYVDENEYDKYRMKARETIFNSSLRAEEFVMMKIGALPPDYTLLLKRELALCFAMEAFGNHFYKGYTESMTRSKTYGEFSVMTSIKNNPTLLKSSIDTAGECIAGIKAEIQTLADMINGLGMSNLKGSWNEANPLTFRLWFHNNLPQKSQEIFATDKVWYHGNIYKEGNNVSNSGIEDRRRTKGSSIYNY